MTFFGFGSSGSKKGKEKVVSSSTSLKRRKLTEVEEFLFLVLGEEIIAIDFNQVLSEPSWPHVEEASVYKKKLLNIDWNHRVIVGLKHIKMGNNVYLIGGEMLQRGTNSSRNHVQNNEETYIGPSHQAFCLKRNDNNTLGLDRASNMDLNYGKCSHMVAKIGDKIFVLGGRSYFNDTDCKVPKKFEAYIPDSEYWRMLTDPPSYLPEPKGKIIGHFVLGNKFIVVYESGAYSYDTIMEEWEPLQRRMLQSFEQAKLALPINGVNVTPFFPQLHNSGIEILLSRVGIEKGYAILMNSSTGSLLHYQRLGDVFAEQYHPMEKEQRVHLFSGRNFFITLPNNRVCAMWVALDHYKRLRIFITIFEMQLALDPNKMVKTSLSSSAHPSYQATFLETQIVHMCDRVVPKDKTPYNDVFDAFIHKFADKRTNHNYF